MLIVQALASKTGWWRIRRLRESLAAEKPCGGEFRPANLRKI
jgi:hypothetical protein